MRNQNSRGRGVALMEQLERVEADPSTRMKKRPSALKYRMQETVRKDQDDPTFAQELRILGDDQSSLFISRWGQP